MILVYNLCCKALHVGGTKSTHRASYFKHHRLAHNIFSFQGIIEMIVFEKK